MTSTCICASNDQLVATPAMSDKRRGPWHLSRERLAAIGFAVYLAILPSGARSDSLNLQGSTVVNAHLFEPHRSAIEKRSGQKLSIIPNKSIHGLVALADGRADIAMISSALNEELEILRRMRPALQLDRLKSFEISRTRIAFAVHPGNSVTMLSLDKLRAILLGEIRNWRDVGGADLEIVTVSVQPGGGVPSTVRRALLDNRAFSPGKLAEVEASHHVVKIVEQEPTALGVTQLGLIRSAKVRELQTERRIEQPLNLVTLDGPSDAQMAVIDAARAIAADRLF